MRIKKGFILRSVANTNIVVPLAKNLSKSKGMLSLNESGALLWNRLKEGAEKEDLLQTILEEYEIDEKTALTDIESFLNKIRAIGALDE